MARRATKDTYGIDSVGGVEVRRLVFAGQMVPPGLQVEEGSYEEVEGGTTYGNVPEPPPDRPASEPEEGAESTASSRRKKSASKGSEAASSE